MLNPLEDHLIRRIEAAARFDYPRYSRIHRLRSFEQEGAVVYVKREDELGFGISGSKIRKYSTLLPFLVRQGVQEAVAIGGPFSNHIVGMSQLLKEHRILPILFLSGGEPHRLVGNFLWANLLVDPQNIHFFPNNTSSELVQVAEDYVKKKQEQNIKALAIPVGGSHEQATAGMLTLALDVLRNEKEQKIHFDHLFIESGTGMTACLLLLAFAYLQKKTHFHILLLGDTEEEFLTALEKWKGVLEAWLDAPIPSPMYSLYFPKNARSFGSVNKTVLEGIKEIARTEGFFVDPVYTAKLFMEGKRQIRDLALTGNILFIHTGGGLGLSGFQTQFRSCLFSGS